MECPECNIEMGDPIDTTYSNITTKRASKGQHTGNIYKCESCQIFWLDDFLTKTVHTYHYE